MASALETMDAGKNFGQNRSESLVSGLYALADGSDIALTHHVVTCDDLVAATAAVNAALVRAGRTQGDVGLQLFDIMDLRMLSGLIGEMFVTELCRPHAFLGKNPNIDGYPDILDVSEPGLADRLREMPPVSFLNFNSGGLEVKNTFGEKKRKIHIAHRRARLSNLKGKLVWKAHHRETNNLVALQSDFVDEIPQIVSVFFSNELVQADWTQKQQPKSGSTMTSFCQTERSAFEKLRRGLKLYRTGIGVEKFLGITE